MLPRLALRVDFRPMKRAAWLFAVTGVLAACSTGPIIMVPTFDAASSKHDTPSTARGPGGTAEPGARAADAGGDAAAD